MLVSGCVRNFFPLESRVSTASIVATVVNHCAKQAFENLRNPKFITRKLLSSIYEEKHDLVKAILRSPQTIDERGLKIGLEWAMEEKNYDLVNQIVNAPASLALNLDKVLETAVDLENYELALQIIQGKGMITASLLRYVVRHLIGEKEYAKVDAIIRSSRTFHSYEITDFIKEAIGAGAVDLYKILVNSRYSISADILYEAMNFFLKFKQRDLAEYTIHSRCFDFMFALNHAVEKQHHTTVITLLEAKQNSADASLSEQYKSAVASKDLFRQRVTLLQFIVDSTPFLSKKFEMMSKAIALHANKMEQIGWSGDGYFSIDVLPTPRLLTPKEALLYRLATGPGSLEDVIYVLDKNIEALYRVVRKNIREPQEGPRRVPASLQKIFEEEMAKLGEEIEAACKEGACIRELLAFANERRYEIAHKTLDPDFKLYTMGFNERSVGTSQFISYVSLANGDHLIPHIKALLADATSYQIEEFDSKGTKLSLTSIRKSIESTRDLEGEFYWLHTDPTQFPAIKEELNLLYQQLPAINQEASLIKIAEIHWWLTQGTFFKRGSAAISEAICEGLLKVHLPELKVKKKSLPDIYALTYTKQQFQKMYRNKFIE